MAEKFRDYRDYLRPRVVPPAQPKWPLTTTEKKPGDLVLTPRGWKRQEDPCPSR